MKRHTKMLTTTEVAELLGVHPCTVARWVNEGRLRAFKTLGGHRRIPMAEVLLIQSQINPNMEGVDGPNDQ